MNKINLSSILKVIDIKNLISIFLIIVVFFGLNTFVVKPRESSNKASQKEIDEVSKETKSIISQTDEILAGGSDSIGDVINKLSVCLIEPQLRSHYSRLIEPKLTTTIKY